jgi:hypothetical protein
MKPIPWFPKYYASKTGRIFSKKKNWMIELKWRATEEWRMRYRLQNNTKILTTFNHRLVLAAYTWYFWEIACHKDDDINNNHIDNLYWWDKSTNIDDAKRNYKLSKWARFSEEEILNIYNSKESQAKLAKQYWCHQATIRSIKLWKSYSYITGCKTNVSFSMHFNNEEVKYLESITRIWFNWLDLKKLLLNKTSPATSVERDEYCIVKS